MTDGLVAFLKAQLDEDEQVARAATPGPWTFDENAICESIKSAKHGPVVSGSRGNHGDSVFSATEDARHIARQDPARVLAEVDAKRRILAEHLPVGYGDVCLSYCHTRLPMQKQDWPCLTLRLLALPYADQPGYKPEWAPGN